MSAPPGWYPDPSPPPGHPPAPRWWDGSGWTEHFAAAPGHAPGAPRTHDGEELAGWGRRFAAYLVDGLVTTVATLALGFPFLIGIFREAFRAAEQGGAASPWRLDVYGDELGASLGLTVIGLVVVVGYHGGFLRWRGATPGKLLLGLRVRLAERPGRLPWSTIALRLLGTHWPTLLSVVPVLGSIVAIYPILDGLWPLWDDRRQTLHDKLARTQVVRVG